jgi:uncharacterized protein YecT (DUF1311 family)
MRNNMRNNMRKLRLTFLLGIGLLAGCGRTGNEKSNETTIDSIPQNVSSSPATRLKNSPETPVVPTSYVSKVEDLSDNDQSNLYSKHYQECLNQPAPAEGEEAEDCRSGEVPVQEARLDEAFAMVMARLDAAQQAKLLAAERQWNNQQGTECEREANQAGNGSVYTILFQECSLGQYLKRRQFLEHVR